MFPKTQALWYFYSTHDNLNRYQRRTTAFTLVCSVLTFTAFLIVFDTLVKCGTCHPNKLQIGTSSTEKGGGVDEFPHSTLMPFCLPLLRPQISDYESDAPGGRCSLQLPAKCSRAHDVPPGPERRREANQHPAVANCPRTRAESIGLLQRS